MTTVQGGRCVAAGVSHEHHAHLIGSNMINRDDLAPSAVLSTVFFLLVFFVAFLYYRQRLKRFAVAATAILCSALAFAIHAGSANRSAEQPPSKSATQVEQMLFVLAQIAGIAVHVSISRDLIARVTMRVGVSKVSYVTYVMCVLSFVLSATAFSKGPDPVNSHSPTGQYTSLRVSAAVFPFLLVLVYALSLPFERAISPLLLLRDVAVLDLLAWFLLVPSFYVFCVAVVNSESSPLACSPIWFYLALGFFQILGLVPILVIASFTVRLDSSIEMQRMLADKQLLQNTLSA
ncbi:hypothetical protein ACM66B_000832 [Microbotryomycetes sp. NB124-2]